MIALPEFLALCFSILEITGVITALYYVVFAAAGQRICFVFGLASSLIYVYITYVAHYYYDCIIQIYYVVMSVYGWYLWSGSKNDESIMARRMQPLKFSYYVIAGFALTGVFGYLSSVYTDASLPYVDGFTTVFAFIATWLVVKRYLENWLIWIVVDAIGIGMYWWKALYFTSLLFLIYTIVAIAGYYAWKKKLIVV